PATASCCALSPSPPIPRSPRSLLTATATTGIYTRSLHDALPIFISRDTGFDTLIKHLKERGIKVQRERDLAEIPVVRMSTATSADDKVAAIVKNLAGRGQSRPRKVKTLSNTINSLFTEKLSEQQLISIVKDLEQRNYIRVSNGNVSYQLPG